ncbi:MAG TPA: hypothetical protein VMH40_09040 [Myxococcaceae bacterium]|nr:hypothetical protein [Myxococcaceae bacterium]
MKRPHLWFRNVVHSGRHCHPLGLLLVGLIVATLGTPGPRPLAPATPERVAARG